MGRHKSLVIFVANVPVNMEPWGATKKALSQCSSATGPARVPSQLHLTRVSSQSDLSSNDKGDETVPEIVHESPGICPTAEGNRLTMA